MTIESVHAQPRVADYRAGSETAELVRHHQEELSRFANGEQSLTRAQLTRDTSERYLPQLPSFHANPEIRHIRGDNGSQITIQRAGDGEHASIATKDGHHYSIDFDRHGKAFRYKDAEGHTYYNQGPDPDRPGDRRDVWFTGVGSGHPRSAFINIDNHYNVMVTERNRR